jgi:ABC-type multidrug transport system fused ATPase/permease subunit
MGVNRWQESIVGVQRVKAYFDEKPEIEEAARPIKDVRVKGRIRFESVDFAYEENRQVLFDNSFGIASGETVAFVGESGSGKSTITNLIFRFYDPIAGEISLDGRRLKDYSVRFLRQNIGVVFQETELFAASLRENLAYGVIGKVSDEEIMRAVRLSLLDDVVERLPDKLDTMVEERGGNFSGGEKQRIAICRLILKKPSIVIFDEATSALDSESEKAIQSTIDRIMQEPTSILIAHRLSTVIHANKILVLKDGRIVERGTHQQLLDAGGEYRTLWDEQLKESEKEQAKRVPERAAELDLERARAAAGASGRRR